MCSEPLGRRTEPRLIDPSSRSGGAPSRRPTAPDRLSHPLRTVGGMQVQDARRVRKAAEALAAAVAAIDLGAMLPATHQELVALGERIERTGRTLKSLAAAKVAE